MRKLLDSAIYHVIRLEICSQLILVESMAAKCRAPLCVGLPAAAVVVMPLMPFAASPALARSIHCIARGAKALAHYLIIMKTFSGAVNNVIIII